MSDNIQHRTFWKSLPLSNPFCIERGNSGECLISAQFVILDFSNQQNQHMSNDKTDFSIIEDGTHYELPTYKVVDGKGIEKTGDTLSLMFVRGSKLAEEEVEKREGILHETLLAAMIFDLKFKYNLVPSDETLSVIGDLEKALKTLGERQRARESAHVEGTYKKAE